MVDFKKALAEKRLQERIDKATAPVAASMTPEYREEIPLIQKFVTKPVDRLNVARLINQHITLARQEAELASSRESIDAQIAEICNRYEVKAARHGATIIHYQDKKVRGKGVVKVLTITLPDVMEMEEE
jgi:hypothetical protein